MAGSLTPLSVLGPQAGNERQRIRQQFEAGTSARETLHALCELADNIVRQIFIFEGEYLNYNTMDQIMQKHEAYRALPTKVAQAVVKQVHET